VCPTRYRTRHFFNNSNTNEDIATKFEQEYVRCVRNEEECVCSVCLFCFISFIGVRIIKEMPGSVASGTPCIFMVGVCCAREHSAINLLKLLLFAGPIIIFFVSLGDFTQF